MWKRLKKPSEVSVTSSWFADDALPGIAARYRNFPVAGLSYATVRDFCDSFDHLQPLATAQGDLKDVQRPWVLKAILAKVPVGGRVLEIGGGQPFVADLLQRLGYEAWIVDPYDGSGNGPLEFERYRTESPRVKFVRALFDDRLVQLPPGGFDCIYSISVLEHVDYPGLEAVLRGMKRFLKPDGTSIHAIDHVHKGAGDREHLDKVRFMTAGFGLPVKDLDPMLARMTADTETYYLSAESHNRWRGGVPYEQFPMRICVSIQMFSTCRDVQSASPVRPA